MGIVGIKTLSIIWGVVFCTICGFIVACGLAVMQWACFKFGWYMPDSGKPFRPDFWDDFFLIGACVVACLFVILFREFLEDGIKIDPK